MRSVAFLASALIFVVLSSAFPPATASQAVLNCESNLQQSERCVETPGELNDIRSEHPNYTYDFEPVCRQGKGDNCFARTPCSRGRQSGWIYDVYINNRYSGSLCLLPSEVNPPQITPAMVWREMQRLKWPAAIVSIQPANGKTLVNFDTNFYTTTTETQSQTVELLGQSVTIEAAPTSYAWDFGDGASTSTSSPGAPYPDLDITHAYEQPGEVSPSVDVTYSGRFRVGDGDWQDIPETLTVPGAAVALQILEGGGNLTGEY